MYKCGLGCLQLASRVIKQIAGNNYFATYSPLFISGHEKTRKLMIQKFAISKKGIGIKSEGSMQTSYVSKSMETAAG